jgi:hypothetical protein
MGKFAALAPDEDFVETFKLKVLTSATPPLTNLPIQITIAAGPPVTLTEDIPSTLSNRPELQRKVGCLSF